ncbi:MAG: GDP-mannose 4,6-dehydratase [Lachnospiraceae bacterium]|nr:GDP-mannose 4,6-dehydratase [Lachnospiraceae bacterium]
MACGEDNLYINQGEFMKRILVTGGAGFIGSYLCERFVSERNDVICVDNFFTGSKRNIEKLFDSHNFGLIRHDVTKELL